MFDLGLDFVDLLILFQFSDDILYLSSFYVKVLRNVRFNVLRKRSESANLCARVVILFFACEINMNDDDEEAVLEKN